MFVPSNPYGVCINIWPTTDNPTYADSKKKRCIPFIHMFWIIRNCARLSICKTVFLLLLGSVILLPGKHQSIVLQMNKMLKGRNSKV